MTLAGAGGLFLFLALCAAAMTGFGLWRLAATETVPGDAQQDFQILPRTTPTAALLDPAAAHAEDRTSVVWGKSVSVRVAVGGGRILKKKQSRQEDTSWRDIRSTRD